MSKYFFAMLMLMNTAKASTFVGNGGSAGDVELQVVVNQLQTLMARLQEKDSKSADLLCSCNSELNGHETCTVLNSLNSDQRKFCGEFLKKQAPAIQDLVNEKGISLFHWTNDSIEVKVKNGKRAVEAVADRKTGTVFLNKAEFLSRRSYERLFLVTHELLHLVQYENSPIDDEQKIGPFQSSDGGRSLLNSAGAAVSMLAIEEGQIAQYQTALTRSKAHRRFWAELALSSGRTGADPNSKIGVASAGGSQLEARYQDGILGALIYLQSASGDSSAYTTVQSKYRSSSAGLGVSFKYQPFGDPLSFLGQSYLLLLGGVESRTVIAEVKDTFISMKDTVSSTSPFFGIRYYFPLQNNFWLSAGMTGTQHNFRLNEFGQKYSGTQTNTNLGVAYAF